MKKFEKPEVKVICLNPSDTICVEPVLISTESKLTVYGDTSKVLQEQYIEWKKIK